MRGSAALFFRMLFSALRPDQLNAWKRLPQFSPESKLRKDENCGIKPQRFEFGYKVQNLSPWFFVILRTNPHLFPYMSVWIYLQSLESNLQPCFCVIFRTNPHQNVIWGNFSFVSLLLYSLLPISSLASLWQFTSIGCHLFLLWQTESWRPCYSPVTLNNFSRSLFRRKFFAETMMPSE